jgi:hypothetical protein
MYINWTEQSVGRGHDGSLRLFCRNFSLCQSYSGSRSSYKYGYSPFFSHGIFPGSARAFNPYITVDL